MGTQNSGRVRRLAAVGAVLAASLVIAGCNDSSGPSGCWGDCQPYTPLVTAFGLGVADFNGDGKPDVATVSWYRHDVAGNIALYLHDTAASTYGAPLLTPNGVAPSTLTVADINGDGYPDLVTSSNDGGFVSIVLNSGDGHGTFGAPSYLASQGATGVAVGDLNGDGLPDLVIADPGPTGGGAPVLSVLLNDPAHPGQFLPAINSPLPPQTNEFSIKVADLNGDGLPDILVGGDSTLSVFLQQPGATTSFAAPATYALPGVRAFQVEVADVNGDGLPDVLTTSGPTQTLSNGVLLTRPGVLYQDPSHPGTFGALTDLP